MHDWPFSRSKCKVLVIQNSNSTVDCRKVPSAVLGQNDILMFFGPDSPFLAPHKITELNSKYFICYT